MENLSTLTPCLTMASRLRVHFHTVSYYDAINQSTKELRKLATNWTKRILHNTGLTGEGGTLGLGCETSGRVGHL